jgi:hypothetical protein
MLSGHSEDPPKAETKNLTLVASMKWFHHETAARHDPKLQMLGSTHGAEGIGIFWGLLEEIGQHSDTFHLKVLEISTETDQTFMKLAQDPEKSVETSLDSHLDLRKVPRLTAKILAKNLFTSPRKLKAVIETCVHVGLFDSDKWWKFNLLYSPSFEQRADDYTRRVQRRTENVRTRSEHSPDNHRSESEQGSNDVRRKSEKVPLESEAEQIQKEKRRRTEKDMLANNMFHKKELSTSEFHNVLKDEPYLIELSEEGFQEYSRTFRSTLASWNDGRPNKFDWNPSDSDLRKLFFGGEHEHKVTMCYHAFKLLGEKVHYPELVLRALKLMLKSSEKSRIVNPFGWMWTCLHGNGDGTAPWVQLLSAEEEQSLESVLRRYRPP